MTKLSPATYKQPVTIDALDDVTAANAYDALEHKPWTLPVTLTYAHFKFETMAQWADIIDSGVHVEFHDGAHEYANSTDMLTDLEHGHLWTRITGADDVAAFQYQHPMLEIVDVAHAPGLSRILRLNDVFRVVHDVNGHGRSHSSFGPNGERKAWLAHRDLYSREALSALWCETRGQAAWTNAFGEHAALPLRDRPFAIQKAGMPPKGLI